MRDDHIISRSDYVKESCGKVCINNECRSKKVFPEELYDTGRLRLYRELVCMECKTHWTEIYDLSIVHIRREEEDDDDDCEDKDED